MVYSTSANHADQSCFGVQTSERSSSHAHSASSSSESSTASDAASGVTEADVDLVGHATGSSGRGLLNQRGSAERTSPGDEASPAADPARVSGEFWGIGVFQT